jgi:Holliday junction resolvase-like predicted endonuclease
MKAYRPWLKDIMNGLLMFSFALFAMVSAVWLAKSSYYYASLGSVIAAIMFMSFGVARFNRAKARKFGKVFEEEWIQQALTRLNKNGWAAKSCVIVNGLGDIDIVAKKKRLVMPIEIKSFAKWNQSFFLVGERERKAFLQSERQRQFLKAPFSIIWLPQGKPGFFQRLFGVKKGNVLVVFGDDRVLHRAMQKICS